MRKQAVFALTEDFITKALYWADQNFSNVAYFSNCGITFPHNPFPQMIAAGGIHEVEESSKSFDSLKAFCQEKKDWLFGYFTYDLKNEIEKLSSLNYNRMAFPGMHFFQPETLLFFENEIVKIECFNDPYSVYTQINSFSVPPTPYYKKIQIYTSMPKPEYLEKVEAIKQHIVEGDVYEMNFCIEFFADNAEINPVASHLKLSEISPAPFSAFMKFGGGYLLSASPERFIKKSKKKLISQPIKGTIRRGKNTAEDELLKIQLQNDEKERAENMMIVDLVRNDLAKSSVPGTVKVEEIFGIYSFRHVHQMISTISSEIRDEVHFIDAIQNAFPMGSMTGAPKIKVMELIDRYENALRGLYSGAAGFITPNGDFDFNVVIRSILYNQKSKSISFQAGSAITYDSVAEKEYEECLLKAKGFFELFGAIS